LSELVPAERAADTYTKNRLRMRVTRAIVSQTYEFTSSRNSNLENFPSKSVTYKMPFSVEIDPIMYRKSNRKSIAASSFA